MPVGGAPGARRLTCDKAVLQDVNSNAISCVSACCNCMREVVRCYRNALAWFSTVAGAHVLLPIKLRACWCILAPLMHPGHACTTGP